MAVLALTTLALLAVMTPQGTFTQDEGAYALQARALEQGSWEYDYKAAPLDPDRRYFPVVLSTRSGDRFFTYIQHPAYPLLLRAATAVAGTALGLHLIALLGAVGAAAAAWMLAAEVDGGLRRPAFWLAATSPVLVNGMLLWAHAPSAAMAGFAMVAGARIARRGLTPAVTLGAVAALVAGVLLRSEGVLFGCALSAGVGVLRLRAAGIRPALITAGALTGPVVVVALLERAWIRSIVGGPFDNLAVRDGADGSTSYLAGRFDGAFHSLFQGHDSTSAAGLPVLAALGLAAGLGFVALRQWRPTSRRDLTIAVAGVVLLYLVRVVQHPSEAVTGLFAAWPLAVLGLLLVPRRDRPAAVELCLIAVALFFVAVVLTQYPEGGGLEWGGRFFSPATVPLAVVAAAALAHRIREFPEPERLPSTLAIGGLAAAAACFGLVTVGRARAHQDQFIAAAARHPATVTVTTVEIFPRVAWRTHDRLNWMITDDEGLLELLATLKGAGVPEVVVVTREDVPPADLSAYGDVVRVDEPALARAGAAVLRLR